MKIGIYGGTFNPPHIGHVQSAKAAYDQLGLDMLIIVPAGVPPHKPLPDAAPPAKERFHMTLLAFEDALDTKVSDIEVKKTEPSYTIDTVMALTHIYQGAQVFLLVGADMFVTLDTWKDSESLLRKVTPAVFSRSTGDMERVADNSMRLKKRYGVRAETVINNVIKISSSRLRDMLPEREGIGYINDTTYAYIIMNRLYGAKPNWKWLRARAYSMLDPIRIPHVEGCEEEALRLAKRWGVDLDDAREATILHDITKKLDVAENASILEDHGISVDKLRNAEEKLLHSRSGAVLAKEMFGVSNEVADAIKWHTTGRAGMSALEKVIYLADYIEPMRDFSGVDALRSAAYEDIDEAMRIGLEMSILDLVGRGITPNRTTFEALNDFATAFGHSIGETD